jgi:hypothetical protein
MRLARAGIRAGLLLAVCLTLISVGSLPAQEYARDSGPELFSYDELVELGSNQDIRPELVQKLHALTNTPFVNNEAYFHAASHGRSASTALVLLFAWPFGILSAGLNSTTFSCFSPIRNALWQR